MTHTPQHAISPRRSENYPEWFQQVIKAAELAESSPVRGCMVIKPWGYGIWELIQRFLDEKIKETGHENAYFPLLIPMSFLEKEATHVEGFAKECAVVTHHRLEAGEDGGLVPAGKLQEPYVIRPTSETIIGHFYSKWVNSYRDLPLLINQWANVMRWEMRPRLFLRTSEFLWQEGHTVHASKEDAEAETLRMLEVYRQFCEDYLAMPVISGIKTPDERFPGADETYTIEAMMQDGKALQAGTSHFLGQNFAKASDITFLDRDGTEKFAWTTSWGVTTRLIGGVIMTHSDDDGLVLPPAIAPRHVVILPIYKNDEDRSRVLAYCQELKTKLLAQSFRGTPLRVAIDDRDLRGGEKSWSHIKKGVPIRLEIGPKDIAKNAVCLTRRDHSPRQKSFIGLDEFLASVTGILEEQQIGLLEKARHMRATRTQVITSIEEFKAYFADDAPGGFAVCHLDESVVGHSLMTEFKVTPRCIPLDPAVLPAHSVALGTCLFSGKATSRRVILAKSY